MDERNFGGFEENLKQFLYRCPAEIIKPNERLGEKIGEGGFGVVYSLENSDDCIKFSLMDEQIYYRNKRGLSNQIALQKITENVVKIKGFYEDKTLNMYAIRMERLVNLKTFIDKSFSNWSLIPEDFVIQVGLSVIDVIQKMRELNAVHLDIKIDNLFVRIQNRRAYIVLGDFEAGNIKYEGTYMAGTKVPIYSEDVVAPEIVTTQSETYPCNHLCDQYSLGATLYALLNGGRYIKTMVCLKLYPNLPKPERCSDRLFKIVSKMMSIEPVMRYQYYEELKHDLLEARRYLSGNVSSGKESNLLKKNCLGNKGNNKRILFVICIVFLVVSIFDSVMENVWNKKYKYIPTSSISTEEIGVTSEAGEYDYTIENSESNENTSSDMYSDGNSSMENAADGSLKENLYKSGDVIDLIDDEIVPCIYGKTSALYEYDATGGNKSNFGNEYQHLANADDTYGDISFSLDKKYSTLSFNLGLWEYNNKSEFVINIYSGCLDNKKLIYTVKHGPGQRDEECIVDVSDCDEITISTESDQMLGTCFVTDGFKLTYK